MSLLYVFLGGGLGSLCRYGISIWYGKSTNFPIHTLLANIFACFILGFVIEYQIKHNINASRYLLLTTGFCGGFSTFSTFSIESLHLLMEGKELLAIGYILTSVLSGILSVYLGMIICKIAF